MNLWSTIAQVVSRPRIRALLIKQAQKRPYEFIGNYMHRWWLIPESWGLPFAVRINHIMREDLDPFLHDHPWDWRTIILDGWYIEEDAFGNLTPRFCGDTRVASAETLHRIHEVRASGVWTLFITGRNRNRWGFMVGQPARKKHWRDYRSPNNREAA